MSNSLGKHYRFTTFGESHGKCIGAVIDGCPAGHKIDIKHIQAELNRRRPGQSKVTTTRNEQDQVEILSGIFNGYTTGAPIAMIIWNQDRDSTKYEDIKNTPRPGHADYTAYVRYGGYQDYRGGGRFSGRNTAGFVMAGALAKQVLANLGIEVFAYTQQIGGTATPKVSLDSIKKLTEKSIVRCPDAKASSRMIQAIEKIKTEGDSLGGKVRCIATNIPPGLGSPVFDTLEGDISKALFSVPAVKAIEFGAGTSHASMKGSESNDEFIITEKGIQTKTNHSGGIQGGISNGMPIDCTVTIKPTPSIGKQQKTINIKEKKETILQIEGRHDPCIVPRAVPVIESMIAIVLLDHAIQGGVIKRVLEEKK